MVRANGWNIEMKAGWLLQSLKVGNQLFSATKIVFNYFIGHFKMFFDKDGHDKFYLPSNTVVFILIISI